MLISNTKIGTVFNIASFVHYWVVDGFIWYISFIDDLRHTERPSQGPSDIKPAGAGREPSLNRIGEKCLGNCDDSDMIHG